MTRVPKARSGHRIAIDDLGHLYSFGGYNPHINSDDEDLSDDSEWLNTRPLFRELWKFDMTQKKWIKLRTGGESPTQLASHCAVIVDRLLIVYGGTGVPFGQSSSNLIHTCNLDTLMWQKVRVSDTSDPAQQPIEQYGQAIAVDVDEGCLYVVGGTTGYRYTIDVHKFDFRTQTWHELYRKIWGNTGNGPFPEERYRHEIVLYKKKLYVFGGGTADTCFGFKEVAVFDLTTCTWEPLLTKVDPETQEYPKPRRCHGCVQRNNQVYIVGGIDGNDICDDLWRLNLETAQWTKLRERMPLPVYFHGTGVSQAGQMFVFGGVNSAPHNQRNNDLFSIWLEKAPLREIAWQALISYCDPNVLNKTSPEDLMLMGIPLPFVRRLHGVHALRPALPS